MTDPDKAVFLSYASQDASAAQRLCDSLRTAGIEVWFDQRELRGGDAWDRQIRRQIRECALFIPLLSHTTQFRLEGYFRREWKLAADRTHDMAEGKPFLIPVVIDDTPDQDAAVPDAFRAVQWSQLPGGESSPSFVARLSSLLGLQRDTLAEPLTTPTGNRAALTSARPSARGTPPSAKRLPMLLTALVVLAGGAAYGYLHATKGKRAALVSIAEVPPAVSAVPSFVPPPHSLAVLPFLNISGDPKDDYFADGLSEELLNSLAAVRELQVAARTSAFSFKGKQADIAEIARKLNVGAILEGSVRREGEHVRITAQLIDATSGFHLWSQTYDRDLKGVLKLESDVAQNVSSALRATLLASTATTDMGGTDNPQAFDAYLKGETLLRGLYERSTNELATQEFARAIRLDRDFANAYLGKSLALFIFAGNESGQEAKSAGLEAKAAAEQAIKLAPRSGNAHSMLGSILAYSLLNFRAAQTEFEAGLDLSPGDARVYSASASYLALTGHSEEAIQRARKSVVLDPLNASAHANLGSVLRWTRHPREAVDSYSRALQIDPAVHLVAGNRGYAYISMGEFEAAVRSCTPPRDYSQRTCLAIAYDKLGRHADADAAIAAMMREYGESASYQFAEIYAQRGDTPNALAWLETADRIGDTGLHYMAADDLADPLRNEPRFKKVLAKLNLP